MRFRSFDSLRVFNVVARLGSFTAAARELHLTKGAVSYQVSRLERELGFALFSREHRRVALTPRGRQLWHCSRAALGEVEREIARLREAGAGRITIAMSTYFASRWLSPRLARFMQREPRIRLRVQPLVDLHDLASEQVDMAIRWGKGEWTDLTLEPLLPAPAFPAASGRLARRVRKLGVATALRQLTLLHDRDDSVAWLDWHDAAGLPFEPREDALTIPDPNVRVQAVIDGQGIALQDALVADELGSGLLEAVSEVSLDQYGYFLAYPRDALEDPCLAAFREWLLEEARPSSR